MLDDKKPMEFAVIAILCIASFLGSVQAIRDDPRLWRFVLPYLCVVPLAMVCGGHRALLAAKAALILTITADARHSEKAGLLLSFGCGLALILLFPRLLTTKFFKQT